MGSITPEPFRLNEIRWQSPKLHFILLSSINPVDIYGATKKKNKYQMLCDQILFPVCLISDTNSFELDAFYKFCLIVFLEIRLEGLLVRKFSMYFVVTLLAGTAALITLYQLMLMWKTIKLNVS